ncbi:hypothetical protein E4U32_000584 [Claviceps aff. humidiphila group G2b]|nr:hypothetical protein E4U32_000584 [Claviceps aff. humidiphila group G2b]
MLLERRPLRALSMLCPTPRTSSSFRRYDAPLPSGYSCADSTSSTVLQGRWTGRHHPVEDLVWTAEGVSTVSGEENLKRHILDEGTVESSPDKDAQVWGRRTG